MLSFTILVSQHVSSCSFSDSLPNVKGVERSRSPDILTSGFIDVITNGQVNASARLLRIFIGEPGKFSVPLSIYSGVSSGNFSSQPQVSGARSNEQLVNGFINPFSGIINITVEGGAISLNQQHPTNAGILYQVGARVLTGYRIGSVTDPTTGKAVNFFNSYGAAGFYFRTGAWEKDDPGNLGSFWISFRYIGSYSTVRSLQAIQPGINSGLCYGWSLGGGIEINELLNFKIIYYKYIREPQIGYVLPICQFSFHYALNPR